MESPVTFVPTGGVPRVQPAGSVGDVNSTAKGSGARFNAGKPKLELIPLRVVHDSILVCPGAEPTRALDALKRLALFQESGDAQQLHELLHILGFDNWAECAHVFEYGTAKYAPWNWAKGMAWSIPLACAARHLMCVIRGESMDAESKRHHFGHVACNVVMLLTFQRTFPEGDDLPRQLRAAA